MHQIQIHRFADDAGIARFGCTHQVGGEFKHGVGVEVGGESVFRQLGAIALHAREADFAVVAVGADGFDLDGLARFLRRRDHGLGGEIEGDAEHVGVFDVEQAFLVKLVRLAAQGAADYLLA